MGTACEQRAEHLLVATRSRDLHLATPIGVPTWKRGSLATTIDLTFATYEIGSRIEYCGPVPEWALTRDHIPIKIVLNVQTSDSQPKSRRYALKKLDIEGLSKAVSSSGWEHREDPLAALQEQIEQALPLYCPKARPSPRARPDWSPRAAELLAGVRQARRRHTAGHSEDDRREAKHLSNQLKQEMRRNARNNWRRLVDELTRESKQDNKRGLWRLSRWSRRAAGKQHEDPQLPALRREPRAPLTTDNYKRTRILVDKFFPPPP